MMEPTTTTTHNNDNNNVILQPLSEAEDRLQKHRAKQEAEDCTDATKSSITHLQEAQRSTKEEAMLDQQLQNLHLVPSSQWTMGYFPSTWCQGMAQQLTQRLKFPTRRL